MEILFFFLVVLLFVTLIGHGIWVLLAWMLRGFEPSPRVTPEGMARSCPRCDSQLIGGQCAVCLWPAVRPRNDVRKTVLRDMMRRLHRLRELQIVDDASCTQLLATLQDQLILADRPIVAPEPVAGIGAEPTPVAVAEERPAVGATDEPTRDELDVAAVAQPTATQPVHVSLPLAERARRFAARQKQRAAEPAPPEPVKPPRRPWTDLLAAFMEEKNIRWGELVGGLLIVGCSIALVISFWAKIAERPFLKFFVFNGVTAALFGLGIYSGKRWKLRTTSEGLLITASLLVPLNFLSIAAFTQGAAVGGVLTIVGELISIALFAALLHSAGQIVVPGHAWWMSAGTLVPSVLMLLTRRFVSPDATGFAAEVFGWSILAAYALVNGVGNRQASSRSEPSAFKLLGIGTFATFLAMALLVHRMGDLTDALHRLSPLVCAASLTPLFVGLLAWRGPKATLRAEPPPSPVPVAYRTAGLSIAVAGALLLVGGVVLAWPTPLLLLTAAVIAAATLSVVAWVFRLPEAYLLATLCVVIGYLTGWHGFRGHLPWRGNDAQQTIHAIVSGESSQALLPLAGLLAAVVVILRRAARGPGSRYVGFGVLGVVALSVAGLTWFGFGVEGDPLGVTLFYAVYAVAAYVAAEWLSSRAALCGSAALLFGAIAQGIVFWLASRQDLALPWTTALISDAAAMGLSAVALVSAGGAMRRQQFAPTLIACVKVVSVATVGLLASGIGNETSSAILFPRCLALTGVWLLVAWLGQSALWISVFQVGLAAAIWFGVASRLELRTWFSDSDHPWLDPWTIIAEGIALTIFCLAWFVVRGWLAGSGSRPGELESVTDQAPTTKRTPARMAAQLRTLLAATWPSVESVLLRLLLIAAVGLAIYVALPGVAQELSPRLSMPGATLTNRVVPPIEQFRIAGIPHDHARCPGMWAWLGLLAVTLMVERTVRRASWNVLGLLLVASLGCPLLASDWQEQVATASALRWLSAGYLFVASSLVWSRHRLADWAGRWKWPGAGTSPQPSQDATPAIGSVFALSLLPLVAMAVYVGATAIMRHPPDANTHGWFWPLELLCVVAATSALTIRWLLAHGPANSQPTSSSVAMLVGHGSSLLFLLGAAPLISVTLFVVATALKQSPILGPDPESWFARAGLATSYAVPVLVAALTMIGYAIRETSARFAFAGGLVLNLGVTAAYLLATAKTGLQFDATQWIRLAQLNAVTSGVFAIAWTLLSGNAWRRLRWRASESLAGTTSDLLITQVSIPVALNVLVLVPAWLAIFWNPWLSMELAPLATIWAWIAVIVALLAVLAIRYRFRSLMTTREWLVVAFAVGTVAAAYMGHRTAAGWAAYRVLLLFHVGLVATIAGGSWFAGQRWLPDAALVRRRAQSRTGMAVSIPALALGLRALAGDPEAPWWTVAGFTALAICVVWFAGWSLRRGLLHYAAAIIVLAAIGWWSHEGSTWLATPPSARVFGFAQVLIMALALPTVSWVLIERRVFDPAGDLATKLRLPRMQRLAVRLSIIVLAMVIAISLFVDLAGESGQVAIGFQWLALTAVIVAATALLWDAGARDAIALLYVAGLMAVATLLDAFDLRGHWMLWFGTTALSAFCLATSYLWSCRRGMRHLADVLGIPQGANQPFAGLRWLVPANGLLAAIVVTLVFAIELTYAERELRILAAKAILACAISVGLLARGERRSALQFVALALGALWAIALAWSPLDPGGSGSLLNRSVAVAAALGAITALYGLGFTKLLPAGSEWLSAAQRIAPVLMVTAGVTLLLVLATEVSMFAMHGEVAMAWPAIAVVAVTLVGLSIAALAAALLPGRDPLGLSERGRQVYVYAAEVLLALDLIHIRLTMPWLFRGFFEIYWPLIVMLVAFIGAGVGEWFRRRKLTVLGDPLENTGAMLPLLPVLAFWVVPTQVDYSLLLLSVGLLYAGLSVARKSFGFGVLAAVAANGGLWYFFNRLEGYRLLDHPQLWLIPPAVCVLAAAHIHRRQLAATQLTAIRYACATLVYVSSTADIFLNGVAQAPWLPLVLAGFSLVGIFAGILMRVRAFLFLGIAFLLLAVLTIIWHAAVNLEQTWIWYAAGIVAGVAIIATFAVFEKQRDKVLHVIDELKHWQS